MPLPTGVLVWFSIGCYISDRHSANPWRDFPDDDVLHPLPQLLSEMAEIFNQRLLLLIECSAPYMRYMHMASSGQRL